MVRLFFGYISTGAKLVDAIIEGVLSQDKAFFEGIVVLLLKKITQYWLKRPKKIVTTNFDPVLKYAVKIGICRARLYVWYKYA
jgi:hypothetical protein